MKICLACGASFSGRGWKCLLCGLEPKRLMEMYSFIGENLGATPRFSPDAFGRLAAREAGHFWFRSRNRVILWALEKYFPPKMKFFEIGCGTGFVLQALERETAGLELFGSEIHLEGLRYARERLARTELFQMDAQHIPFRNEFGGIGLFDVLEHIADDQAVLRQVHQALVPGGGLVVTVPQHAFLWSRVDELSGHVRRYEKDELELKIKSAGFRVLFSTSFVSLLLPFFWVARWIRRPSGKAGAPNTELNLHPILNFIFGMISRVEGFLIRLGFYFPWGGSLLMVAKKNEIVENPG